MKKLIKICAVIALFSSGYARAGIWTTIDMPGAFWTCAYGIDGSNIVGTYIGEGFNDHGFLYNGSSWTTLYMPLGSRTQAFGIDGKIL